MPFTSLLLLAISGPKVDTAPLLWLKTDGSITIEGKQVKPRISPGTRQIRESAGYAWDFDGKRCGLLFNDLPALAVTDSFTISTWIQPRSYVNDGPGAQILFRGDDRGGYDAYWFVIEGDGTINFAIADENNRTAKIRSELPLNRWAHVLANYDSQSHSIRMWVDGTLTAFMKTSTWPAFKLDPGCAPGVGIGNVQNDKGPHNQPFNGELADLRLYRGAFTPDDLGIELGNWFNPPAQSLKSSGGGLKRR